MMTTANRRVARTVAVAALVITAILFGIKISSFGSLSEADAKLWVRFSDWILIGSAVLVFVGLWGEFSDSEVWKKTVWYEVAKWAVIAGIFFELFGDASVFQAGDRVSEIQQSEIARQNVEIISLTRNALPRSFNATKFSDRLSGVSPAKVEIRYVAACTDCGDLSSLLSDAFQKAHWSIEPLIAIAPQDRDWVSAVRLLHAQASGVTVVLNTPDKITADPKTAVGALDRALMEALGFGVSGYSTSVWGSVDTAMPPDTIRIVIAPKP